MLCRREMRLILRRRGTRDSAEGAGQVRAFGGGGLVSMHLARAVSVVVELGPTGETARDTGEARDLGGRMGFGLKVAVEFGLVVEVEVAVRTLEFVRMRGLVMRLGRKMLGVVVEGETRMAAGLARSTSLLPLRVKAV